MNKWIVILRDKPSDEAMAVRKEHFPEHFDFLKRNFDRIVFSCGLKEVTSSSEAAVPFGGLWMVEADSRDEVISLLQDDPYFVLGLRGKIDVYAAHEGYI